MREISMHIMDIAENGITAGADCIHIRIEEDRIKNRYGIKISDNGKGMSDEFLGKVTDPFVTTRNTRRVGLGLAFLKEAALRCNGTFHVTSEPGKGTTVEALFEHDHIDRAPTGDMARSMMVLIAGNPGIDFVYTHIIDSEEFSLDTRELRDSDISLEDPEIIMNLSRFIREKLDELS